MTSKSKKVKDQPRGKILVVCNVEEMVLAFLMPWLAALRRDDYEVHVACRQAEHSARLAAEGLILHPIRLHRSFNPLVNLSTLVQLWRMMRRERFDAVSNHSPVAAVLGRLAAWFSGTRNIVYTVHGFYFHDDMPRPLRGLLIGVEWLLGRLTDHFAFVSEEDRQTALRTGIARRRSQTTTIHDGIDLDKFAAPSAPEAEEPYERVKRAREAGRTVVGIVARIVREKGYQEFFTMARSLVEAGKDVVFLIVGVSLATDRDHFGETLKQQVRDAGLEERFIFAGFTWEVPAYLRMMDIFVLPSYREGLPRSILEAMGSGLPVVATDIRGCREEVVHDVTGLIVPPRNAAALTAAVAELVEDPGRTAEMGRQGLLRATEVYDQRLVWPRFVGIFNQLLEQGPDKTANTVQVDGCTDAANVR